MREIDRLQSLNMDPAIIKAKSPDYEEVSKKVLRTNTQKLQQAISIQKQMHRINTQAAEHSLSSSDTDQYPFDKKPTPKPLRKDKQSILDVATSMISVSEDSEDEKSNRDKNH